MSGKNTPEYTVQQLIEDENLRADFADLIPKASRITDAAAVFISASDKLFGGKNQVYGNDAVILARAQDLAQKVVKYGSAISKLLRNPVGSRAELDPDQPAPATQLDIDDIGDDVIHAEVVGEIEAPHTDSGKADEHD